LFPTDIAPLNNTIFNVDIISDFANIDIISFVIDYFRFILDMGSSLIYHYSILLFFF